MISVAWLGFPRKAVLVVKNKIVKNAWVVHKDM